MRAEAPVRIGVDAVRSLAMLVVLALLLFAPAGRWDLPFFWAYFAVFVGMTVLSLFVIDPGLRQERWNPVVRNAELWLVVRVGGPSFLAQWIVPGLDVGRFHWSAPMPGAVQVAALVVMIAGWSVVFAAGHANRFFSPVVRIQTERGHHLITSGPYRFVRHPGYAGAIVGMLAGPVALGSWWGVLTTIPLLVLIGHRIFVEERMLRSQLAGWAEYASRVRYRLIPGIW